MFLSRLLAPVALVASAIAALPAAAEENLDCVAGGFSDEQQARLDEYRSTYDFDALRSPEAPTAVIATVNRRALECGTEHEWSEEAVILARQYGWRALTADIILQAMPLEPMQKFDLLTRYGEADRESLTDAMSAVSGRPFLGREEREPTEADFAVVDSVVRLSDMPDQFEFGVWLGAWLTMSLLRDAVASEFATL